VVDLFLISIPTAVVWVVLLVIATIATSEPTAIWGAALLGIAGAMVVSYHVVLEWLFWTTVGKRLFGLVVVDREGTELTGRTALARNLLRPVGLVGGYLVGGLLVAVSSRHQHLGDRIAGTVVVAAGRLSDEPSEPDTENETVERTTPDQPPATTETAQTSKTT
jgi:uncharacterized RDD family membrane protein YckC